MNRQPTPLAVALVVLLCCLPTLCGLALGLALRYEAIDPEHFWWWIGGCVALAVPIWLWLVLPSDRGGEPES